MNVLFVGKRFYTNRDALREQFGRIYQLPVHWARSGVRTKLWLLDYHTREIHRLRDGDLEIVSTPLLGWAGLRQWGIEALASQKPQVVVASGDCYIGLMAYRLARRLRARFVFDVYDKYDEFAGYQRLPGFDLFDYLLRRSDNRLFASQSLMERVGYQVGRDLIVPNGVDLRRFCPLDMQESRRMHGFPEEAIYIGYFGSMEQDRGVDDLVAAVRGLRSEGVDIELLLGGKPRPDMDLQQPGIRYVGNVPFEQVPTMLACCNLLSVPYRRSAIMDAGASNKIAEAIACGRPLVATRTPNFMDNFPLQAAQLGPLLAEPGDIVDLQRVIREQVARRITVGLPEGMDWPAIATTLAVDLSLGQSRLSGEGVRQ
ncbi:Glycosyltransferase involved in cell wall bisynthesis [Dyella sp. OK004]|uniref:glycosyltransferase family 4 protein n=1 Tax=Dyella sp. OK004 TaxID=1855292 RepID=UPI0008E04DE4|nr:glycosyltransferase family 4 protein [Dyella sp. OK004]SFS05964.1 Glycosyltransferase involved in cell wall bisynthesis [Dyella sp. OK004]